MTIHDDTINTNILNLIKKNYIYNQMMRKIFARECFRCKQDFYYNLLIWFDHDAVNNNFKRMVIFPDQIIDIKDHLIDLIKIKEIPFTIIDHLTDNITVLSERPICNVDRNTGIYAKEDVLEKNFTVDELLI